MAVKKKRSPPKPKTRERELSVADAVSEGFSTLEELGGEYREWYDNLPDSLQQSRDDVDEAANTFENMSEPDVPEALGKLTFKFTEIVSRSSSRAARRDDATQVLDACMTFLDELSDDLEKKHRHRTASTQALNLPELGTTECEELKSAAEELRGELDSLKDEADGVEMPGMYR